MMNGERVVSSQHGFPVFSTDYWLLCSRWLFPDLGQDLLHKRTGFFEGAECRALAAHDMFDPSLNIGRGERRALA